MPTPAQSPNIFFSWKPSTAGAAEGYGGVQKSVPLLPFHSNTRLWCPTSGDNAIGSVIRILEQDRWRRVAKKCQVREWMPVPCPGYRGGVRAVAGFFLTRTPRRGNRSRLWPSFVAYVCIFVGSYRAWGDGNERGDIYILVVATRGSFI